MGATLDDDERAKAEKRLLKRLEEKDLKVGRARCKNCTCVAEQREIATIVYSGRFWQRERVGTRLNSFSCFFIRRVIKLLGCSLFYLLAILFGGLIPQAVRTAQR
jgi:hypothetical protein